MKKIFLTLDNALKYAEYAIVGTGILAMTLLIFINVVLRYIFNTSLMWADELTRYILMWVTCIGANLCIRSGIHVKMDLLHIRLPKKYSKILICATYVITMAGCVLLAKFGIDLTQKVYATRQFSSALPWLKAWVINLAFPLFAVLSIKDLIRLLILNFMRKGETVTEVGGDWK